MSKKPSPEQEIRNLKRLLKLARRDADYEHGRATTALAAQIRFSERFTKAEQEVAEWKRRFDALLERTPNTRSEA